PRPQLFPYTTLFRSGGESSGLTEMPASASAARSYSSEVHSTGTVMVAGDAGSADTVMQPPWSRQAGNCSLQGGWGLSQQPAIPADRKSTRLNSSHLV